MGQSTNIEWCDDTVNVTSGCDGCELWNGKDIRHCYAGQMHETRLAKTLPVLYGERFTDVRLIPGRMAKAARWKDLRGKDRPGKPWLNGLPRHIFISDMADALSRDVPFEYLKTEVIDVVREWPHVGLWLTKQPARMAALSDYIGAENWPSNLYAMTSITSQATAGRIADLLRVGNASTVRALSVEPMLGPVDLEPYLYPAHDCAQPSGYAGDGNVRANWVIVGGESGHGARPCNVEWIRSIVRQCASAQVPCFVKQLGAKPIWDGCGLVANNPKCAKRKESVNGEEVFVLLPKDKKGGEPSEWPEDLRVRQMPNAAEQGTP